MRLESSEESRRLFEKLYPLEFDRFLHEPTFSSSFANSLASMPWNDVWDPVSELGVGGRGKGIRIAVVWGAEDNVVRKEGILEVLIEKLGKGVRVEVVSGEGHSLPYECPKLCAQLILKHVMDKRA
jgi:pimeloyl-ACP methyl ester carboxylesterase